MNLKHILFFFSVVMAFSSTSYGQEGYHRSYQNAGDTAFYHFNSTVKNNGNPIGLGTRVFENRNIGLAIFGLDPKGNVDFQKMYELGRDSVNLLNGAKITLNTREDSLVFVAGAEVNGQNTELLGRSDAGGNNFYFLSVGGNQFATQGKFPEIESFISDTEILLTTGSRPTLSRIAAYDSVVWSRTYAFETESGTNVSVDNIIDIKSALDSTFYILARRSLSNQYLMAKLDSNGVQQWARRFTLESAGNLGVVFPNEIFPLANGDLLVAGEFTNENSEELGFVSLVDTSGQVVWSKQIQINNIATTTKNIYGAEDGTIWIAGTTETVDSVLIYTAQLASDGSVNWVNINNQVETIRDFSSTSLHPNNTTDGGVFLTNAIKPQEGSMQNINQLSVLQFSTEGIAFCNLPEEGDVLVDLSVTTDTTILQVENGGVFLTPFNTEPIEGVFLAPPVLTTNSLNAFCPNEDIDTFLVAQVSDVDSITYRWSDQNGNPLSNDDSLNIFNDGLYIIDVTINENECYTMCDTVMVSRSPLPEGQIAQGDFDCLTDELTIFASLNTGRPPFQYAWSTGESTPSIIITDDQTYTVTVTDACGDIVEFSYDDGLPQTGASVFIQESVDCPSNTVTLLVNGDFEEITWSTGSTNPGIIVTEDGDYSVTVTDICGDMDTDTRSVVVPEDLSDVEVSFEVVCEDPVEESRVVFSANIDNERYLLQTQLGNGNIFNEVSDDNPTEPLQLGNYRFNVIDRLLLNCIELIDTINTTTACGGLLQYPNVFFPAGSEDNERAFGPIPVDSMDLNELSDVTFRVFNRWGELVHDVQSVEELWDGTHNGDPAPSEVYIWYVTYTYRGENFTDKGDVTLIR